MLDELEPRMARKMFDIARRAGEEIVDADDFVALGEEAIDQVRADESRSSGHKDPLAADPRPNHRRIPVSRAGRFL